MSTWISRAGLLLTLAAGLPAAAQPSAGDPGRRAPQVVAVMNGAVKVAGPSGYCIDMGSVRADETSAFLLLANCAALDAQGKAARQAAILTASVVTGAPSSAPLSDSFPQMADFFRSEAGRAALSRVGQARTVKVVSVASAEDVMYIRAADAAATAGGQNVEQDYWRAIFEAKGRIVTLTVLGVRDHPVGAAEKRRLLESFVKSVRKVNGVGTSGG